jgi:hypothetical protein
MASVEDRLTTLETEFAIIRERITEGTDWITRMSGSLKDYPEFDEVLRLGREVRERDRPEKDSEGC